MMQYHTFSAEDLAALASGLGGKSAIQEINSSRLSRHLLLLKFIAQEWPANRRYLDTAVATLAEAQRRSPHRFATLLGDPIVGAWLAHTARRLRDPDPIGLPLSGDLLQLSGLAATAALELEFECEVTGAVRRGRFSFPCLGDAALGDDADGPVTVAVADSQATLTGDFGKSTAPGGVGNWRELRRLTARHDGMTCTVRIEDGSPYRHNYHVAASERLTAGQIGDWQMLFVEAWELLCRYAPERAAELAMGLHVLVPLADTGDGAARSATANDSTGALGLTLPQSAADLAVTLVHEFQHSKLTAVEGLSPLHRTVSNELHYAPWRVDARPTSGLLQGVYAFLGVAQTWHCLRAEPALNAVATTQFATAREQVRVGLEALETSLELTRKGHEFTNGMRAALDRLLAEPLPTAALAAARVTLRARRAAWERHREG